MTDTIFLHGMVFEGRHGVSEDERREVQPIELDVELELDLAQAGRSDDLDQTVDYGEVFAVCRSVAEERSFRLLEGIAEALAGEILARFALVDRLKVRARKPGVPLEGVIEHAGVELERARQEAVPRAPREQPS